MGFAILITSAKKRKAMLKPTYRLARSTENGTVGGAVAKQQCPTAEYLSIRRIIPILVSPGYMFCDTALSWRRFLEGFSGEMRPFIT